MVYMYGTGISAIVQFPNMDPPLWTPNMDPQYGPPIWTPILEKMTSVPKSGY
jgi:hypothetical protein